MCVVGKADFNPSCVSEPPGEYFEKFLRVYPIIESGSEGGAQFVYLESSKGALKQDWELPH